MQKNYLKCLTAAICILFGADLKAQTYTHGHITAMAMPMLSHDSTQCRSNGNVMYNITIDTSYVGDSVMIVDTGTHMLIGAYGNSSGASPWVFSAMVPIYNPVVTDDQISGGGVMFVGPTIKITRNTDTINGINNMFFLPVSNPCEYGNVSGKVYIDNNGDCTFNTGDDALNAIVLTSNATLSGSVPSISSNAYSDASGNYLMTVQNSWMTNYTVSVPPDYIFIFPASPCFSGSYTYTSLPQTGVDFPLLCTSNIDVQCYAGSPASVRINTPFFIQPYVSNTGCDVASGQLKLVKDSLVAYDPSLSYNPAVSVIGDTLIWDYTNLTNLSGGAYWNYFLSRIHLTADTSVHVGDTLCFRVFTNILAGDVNPGNNDYSICLPVVYSYDPNMKEVSPSGAGPEGYISPTTDSLVYTIHFQNTGTSYAANVNIIDTLDADLAPTSLKILGTSHTMSPEWLAPGVVKFNFNNIYLPDSNTNEVASHGFVRFSVKLDPSLAPGTQIKNKGYIYFDLNPPVLTNTALNTIAIPTNTGLLSSGSSLNVYPNPAADHITIENLQNCKISIQNMNGSVVWEQNVTGNKTQIDISRLPSGIYILRCVGQNATTVKKFIKE